MNIEQRRKRALRALREYIREARKWDPSTDTETAIVDLLADLMHVAAARAVRWSSVLKTATGHYHYERLEARCSHLKGCTGRHVNERCVVNP